MEEENKKTVEPNPEYAEECKGKGNEKFKAGLW